VSKVKKTLIYFGVIFILLNIYGVYKRYSHDYAVLLEAELRKAGDVQEFEFSTKNSKYQIGLSVRNSNFDAMNFDGNYTIEYYLNGKHDRTEIINKTSLSELYKNKALYHVSSKWSGGVFFKPVTWSGITLGQVTQAGKHKIKITVHKSESQLANIESQLYFFVDVSNEKAIQEFGWNTSEYKESKRKERLLKNLIDANETNQTLLPLRQALDNNNMTKVKEMIEADNNITVNTDMVFQRRPLHYASFQNNAEIAQYLMDNGADIHHKDELGKNALAYAIENNATKTAKLLIESGVDVKEVVFVQNYLQHRIYGKGYPQVMVIAPLQYVAGNGLIEMTELLLQHNIENREVWVGGISGEIITGENKNGLYSYVYQNKDNGGLTDIEQKKIVELFEKYNFKIEWHKVPSPFKQ
jgi:ankyrin repeat protein